MPLVLSNTVLFPVLENLLQEGKSVQFTPRGVSMRPFIEGDRDSVVVSPVDRSIRQGDIVLARTANGYVLHRVYQIVKQPENLYILMGDGNLQEQETCVSANIMGRVEQIITPNGKAKRMSQGRLWRWLLPIRPWLLRVYRFFLRQRSQS